MKLEYDQCFYKYIEQKTKELFMSVNSVNGISQMQNAQGVSFGSSNQDDGSGLDIGKLLVGGVVVAAVAGVGIAGYKSGKTLKEGDGVLTTVWNGIKSWFGKNGDDVAQAAKNDIPAECKTSLKTLLSGGEISLEAKHNIIANADEISEVFSEKAKRNAQKADKLVKIAKMKDNKEKTNALADFFKIEKKLTLTTDDKLDITGLSLDDQAKITRKLKDSATSITENTINDIITGLQNKYEVKLFNYENATKLVKEINLDNLNDVNTGILKNYSHIEKHFNRTGAAQTLAKNCEDSLSYINTQNSLTKWLKAGDLTQDEYDNLRALAENNFMSKNKGTDYLKYMTQGLKKTNDELINVENLDDESIKLLNDKFNGLNLKKNTSGTTGLTAQQLIDWKRNNTKSISEYLGLNGYSLSPKDASGFKLVDGNLVWEASAGSSVPTTIFSRPIGTNCLSTTNDGTTTKIKLTMKNIREILKSSVISTT